MHCICFKLSGLCYSQSKMSWPPPYGNCWHDIYSIGVSNEKSMTTITKITLILKALDLQLMALLKNN